MAHLSFEEQIHNEIDTLKEQGKPFCPADLAKRYNNSTKKVTRVIGMRNDVKRIVKANNYRPSVWGFVTA
jgi:Mor family transcriptional regulator